MAMIEPDTITLLIVCMCSAIVLCVVMLIRLSLQCREQKEYTPLLPSCSVHDSTDEYEYMCDYSQHETTYNVRAQTLLHAGNKRSMQRTK